MDDKELERVPCQEYGHYHYWTPVHKEFYFASYSVDEIPKLEPMQARCILCGKIQ